MLVYQSVAIFWGTFLPMFDKLKLYRFWDESQLYTYTVYIYICIYKYIYVQHHTGWWLNQPIWKMLVNLDHFPTNRVENKQQYLSCRHLVYNTSYIFVRPFGSKNIYINYLRRWEKLGPNEEKTMIRAIYYKSLTRFNRPFLGGFTYTY